QSFGNQWARGHFM
uniref:Bombesin-like peptide 2 n=1 Tax=Bombina variegata TaxID=8348 RepID=BOML2_BOMVA|nr:RecName: Full=Bombesin-like peptide 2 [Bombina variegata]